MLQHIARTHAREICRRLWESFDISRQRYTYRAIRDKLRQGEPVNPNPYFAIEDNSRAPMQKDIRQFVPTNYNGARSLPDEPLVRALTPRNVHFPRGQTVLLAYIYRTFALIRSRVSAITNGHVRSCGCTANG